MFTLFNLHERTRIKSLPETVYTVSDFASSFRVYLTKPAEKYFIKRQEAHGWYFLAYR